MANDEEKNSETSKKEEVGEENKTNEPKEEKVDTGGEENIVADEEKVNSKEEDEGSESSGNEGEKTDGEKGVKEEDKKGKKKNKAEEKKSTEELEKAGEKVKEVIDENKDGYMSAREVVNALDDIKISEKSTDEIVADQVADQLRERHEYFVLRVRKSVFLVVTGIIVILLWLFTFAPFTKNVTFVNNLKSLISQTEPTPEPTPTPEAKVEETIRIRIKVDGDIDRANALSSILKENGFDTVDVVNSSVEDEGVTIAVKKGEEDLRSKLMEILMDSYNVGSSSSELTDDSDFAAVILMAK